MNASDGVAVIATQIARTDRRALSEAWYSALHLAHDASPARSATAQRVVADARPAALARVAPAQVRGERLAAPLPARARHDANAGGAVVPERRRPVNENARRIERAVERLSARRPVPAAHTLDVAGGRVRLLVHHDAKGLRIVALCSSPLREVVERALASARFALAGTGARVVAP
jgi:hypothetical protein